VAVRELLPATLEPAKDTPLIVESVTVYVNPFPLPVNWFEEEELT
jgi:hypothetical protein